MFSKKHKSSSNDFGAILFNDFVLPSYNNFYNDAGSKKEDIIELELLISYVWLVNHFLNVAGGKYEKVANALNHAFFQYYENNIPSAKLAPLSGDGFFNLLSIKFKQYKDSFMSGSKNMNFEKVVMIISSYVLTSDKPNIDIFFNFKLGTSFQQSAIVLAEILKETEITD
jgi:hypothetical protein